MKTLVFCLAVCVVAPVLAQDVPLPPKPPQEGQKKATPAPRPEASGPSLAVTMKYIQDRLSEQGKVNRFFQKTNSEGDRSSIKYSYGVSGASASSAGCKASFHQAVEDEWLLPDGSLSSRSSDEQSWTVSFRDVAKVVVQSFDLVKQLQDSDSTSTFAPIPPPVFSLTLVLNSGNTAIYHRHLKMSFANSDDRIVEQDAPPKAAIVYFDDEETAQRMAKAMVHAVELCGGGDKDPFK